MGFTEAYFDYLAVKLSKIAALNKLKEVAGHPLGCSLQLIILWRSKWSWVRTRRYQLNQFTIYVCVNLFNIYIAHVLIYAHMLSQFSLERIDDFSSLDKKIWMGFPGRYRCSLRTIPFCVLCPQALREGPMLRWRRSLSFFINYSYSSTIFNMIHNWAPIQQQVPRLKPSEPNGYSGPLSNQQIKCHSYA